MDVVKLHVLATLLSGKAPPGPPEDEPGGGGSQSRSGREKKSLLVPAGNRTLVV
jgi:hypothetical protein